MAPGRRSRPAMSASLPPLRIYQRGGEVQSDREHVLVLRQRYVVRPVLQSRSALPSGAGSAGPDDAAGE